MIFVTVEISTDRQEECILLFPRNALFILMLKLKTLTKFKEERNLAYNEIIIKYTVYIYNEDLLYFPFPLCQDLKQN